jgi:acyl carrier protein
MNKSEEELFSLLARVLGLNISEITDKTSPENTESWDSFNALVMVTELENMFNISFTMQEVQAVVCVADIKKALSSHGVEINDQSNLL